MSKLRNFGIIMVLVIAVVVALSFNFEVMPREQQVITLIALALFIIVGVCSMRLLIPATKQSESY